MKKVLLLLVFVISFFSCSDDSNNKIETEEIIVSNQSKKSSELGSLKNEYANILKSDLYNEASNLTKLFSDKLKIEGYNFENEDYLIEWIINNPESIEFSSPEEAIGQYNILKRHWEKFYSENSSFFSGLVHLSEFELRELVKFEGNVFSYDEYPITAHNDCLKKCLIQGRECIREAQQVYEERLYAAVALARLGIVPAAAGVAANALVQKRADDRRCASQMLSCADGCD